MVVPAMKLVPPPLLVAVRLLVPVLLLGACGQRGPLYLPENAPAARTTSAAEQRARPASPPRVEVPAAPAGAGTETLPLPATPVPERNRFTP